MFKSEGDPAPVNLEAQARGNPPFVIDVLGK
jgi:hypothetical protein